MLLTLIILTTIQIITLIYFGHRLMLENRRNREANVPDTEAEAPVVYVTVDQMETLASQLRAYIDHRISLETVSTQTFGELSEHVDSVLEIVTSLATESEEVQADMVKLVDRVSRLAFNGVTTRELLDKTIDSIDWDDDDSITTPVATEADIANLPPVRGTGTPYRPPTPRIAPVMPVDPLPAPPQPVPVPEPAVNPGANPAENGSVALKEVRGDDDPLITDLRAEPFQDHPDAQYDLHDLPMSAQYEEFGSGGAQTRRSSRTRRL